MEMRS